MKINTASAQIKPRKGDYSANLARIGDLFEQIDADAPQTNLLTLPETVLSGYFLEGGVREAARPAELVYSDLLNLYRARTKRKDAILDISLGFYEIGDGRYYNSALYATLTAADPPAEAPPMHRPGLRHVHRKFFLPTYGVFDEKRFVSRGRSIRSFDTRFGRVSMLICEDVWHSISATLAALKGAQILLIPSASPGREFTGRHAGNVARWNVLLPSIANEHTIWVIYTGLVGFEGGKGFTGSSQVIDPWGNCRVVGSEMEECMVTACIDIEDVAIARSASPLLADLEAALGDIVFELDQIARKPYSE